MWRAREGERERERRKEEKEKGEYWGGEIRDPYLQIILNFYLNEIKGEDS